MEVVTGAMGSLLSKLGELLMEEYKVHKGVKKDVESLSREMKDMHAALRKVAEVPRDQLDEQVRLWADDVRELSYNMEDVIDKFLVELVRVDGPAATDGLKGLMQKMVNLFKKGMTHRRIANAIKDIKKQVQEVGDRRKRYKFDGIMPKPAATTVDPRLRALYTQVTELVGIYGKRDQELIKLLSMEDDHVSNKKLKIVSVVGFGGLGKTTLAKAVYDKIKGGFACCAFVPVGRSADVKKVFRDILVDLDKQKYTNIILTVLDERQLIDELRLFLENKKYLIIIDDIWDEKLVGVLKWAFSNTNDLRSRVITTTRIVSVSKACCSSTVDSVYEMKPLSDDDSKRLFYKRIFPDESGCPGEFVEVSRDILKKCGGVPLAIITIASLLASDQHVKPKDEWHVLLQSIGRGLTEDASLEEMQRILSFSYYDLPPHLKTCLLYISIYPEDREIERDELIWKWVAESFVQCGKQDTSQFEHGETYFNELINRSMIQPVYDFEGGVTSCRVHDMVLDLICSLSSEANFVTVLDCTEASTSSQGNVRRLSLQNRKQDHQTTPLINSMSISQVRSITIFPLAVNIMPALLSFDVLRVLDMMGCYLGESSRQLNLRDVENLFHLRYLGLANTGIRELPAEIGNLQFLEVLDVGYNYDLEELPSTVCKLRRLMFLNVTYNRKSLDGLGNLASMEVLKRIWGSLNIVQELGNLARLRELEIQFSDGSLELVEAFVESVCKLHNIQHLAIIANFKSIHFDLFGERWVPPRHLRGVHLYSAGVFSTLPAWIKRDPSHLSNLSKLSIIVKEVQQEDVRILGSLPALRSLDIKCTHQQQTQRLLLIGADAFRCMVFFTLHCGPVAQLVFEPGALPRAERVHFDLCVRVAKEDGNGDHFDLGLQGNLLSLREADVFIYWSGVTVGEAKEAEAAVRDALDAHPNHPSTYIGMEPSIPEGAHDDEFCDNDDEEE